MKIWLKYVKPYISYFIIGPICMIVEVIGEVWMPKLLSIIIDYGMGTSDLDKAPNWVSKLYEICGNNSPFIITIMVGMILTAIFMMIGGVGGAYFGAKASVNFGADLRNDIYRKVQEFSFSNIDKFSTGSLVTRLTNDVTQIQNFINMLLRLCLRAPGMLIGGTIMALMVSKSLTITLAVALPLIFVTTFFFMRVALPRFKKQQEKIDSLNSTVQENVTNIRVVKSFVRENHEINKFAEANHDLRMTAFNAVKMIILISPAMTLFMYGTLISVIWFGGNMVINSTMTTGELTAFVTYVIQILTSLVMLAMIFFNLSRAMASSKRIKEILNEEIDVTDSEISDEDRKRIIKKGKIEFRNVSFKYYKTSPEKVLDNINFIINPGETVGIIGSTGSGKSTIVSMIARLYDPDEGEILVDGQNVKNYSLYNLREGIGFVLQKNVLFSGTIEDNLKWGNPNADINEIKEMSEYAQADMFVDQFENKYQTLLDQGGTNVSGGQKQRLCIARALLKKPKILVLDDSTSAVDTATESKIREAFTNELKGSTKIIIAQRISSVRNADKILVVNEGKISGIGTHEELLNSNTDYSEIYYSQEENNKEENSI